jgi:hypothetical protein
MVAAAYCESWVEPPVMAPVRETVLGALRQLLRPLVRILLRHGVSFADYAETSKAVFVEVAESDLGLSQDIAGMAVVTGLTRKEIGRVRDELAQGHRPSVANLNRIGRILAGWHQDPEFTGPYGIPLELGVAGSDPSFAELAKRYAPSSDVVSVLAELRSVGVVADGKNGRVRVLTRSYIPTQEDPAVFQFFGVALRDLAETLDFNLNSPADAGYFERRVWTPAGIDPSDLPQFDALVHQRGQQFLETLDNYLTTKETEADSFPETMRIKVGVGVFMFSDVNRRLRDDE